MQYLYYFSNVLLSSIAESSSEIILYLSVNSELTNNVMLLTSDTSLLFKEFRAIQEKTQKKKNK